MTRGIQKSILLSFVWLIACLGGVTDCRAGSGYIGRSCSTWNFRSCCWGPDDYCCKPQPCVRCPAKSCNCDCYDCKPSPCVKCPSGCSYPDDYCRKCAPCPPWQCETPSLPCGIYRRR